MVRSYALTFGAITFRLWLLVLDRRRRPRVRGLSTVAWLAWIPDLIFAELFLRTRGAHANA